MNPLLHNITPFDAFEISASSSDFDLYAGAGASSTSVGPSPGNWLAAHRADLTLGDFIKCHAFENIMENRAFAPLEQMLHFP